MVEDDDRTKILFPLSLYLPTAVTSHVFILQCNYFQRLWNLFIRQK